MNFDDVPDWYYPIRESLGCGAAAETNRRRKPSRSSARTWSGIRAIPARSSGCAKALEAQQKAYEADFVRQSFEAAWKGKEPPRIEDF